MSSPSAWGTMSEVSSPLAQELLENVTDQMVADAAGYREELPETSVGEGTAEATAPPKWSDAISRTAYEFIVRWETGGKAYYEQVIKGRPIWPGCASGITIGCGFDLGYHTLGDFRTQWSSRITASDFERLAQTIGFKTVDPNRSAKVARAQALVRSLSDITVLWLVGIEQFDNAKMPDLVGQLYGALDNLDKLNPHCRGALLSLVFNGGTSFNKPGDRYAEMRAIKAAMTTGTTASFKTIPSQLRSMKRIWGERSSLAERREGEAKLFEAGLRENGLLEGLVALGETETTLEGAAGALQEQHEAVEGAVIDDADENEIAEILEEDALEAPPGLGLSAVRWNPKDDEQPDYRHLDRRAIGTTAEITPDDFDMLIGANSFAPLQGKIVFALRGAGLVGGAKRENVPSITIIDQRPDHRTFRCIIGIYDPALRKLWAYQASSVPNAAYVLKCYRDFQAHVSIDRLTGNILPTGCYIMTVGKHHPGTSREIPGVLRLSTTSSGASQVVVLRSVDDVTYDRFDRFPIATPADNVHPGQMSQGFSSAGCLTLPGLYSSRRHSGSWKDFRDALGVTDTSDGKQFSMFLFTGLDAILAAEARQSAAGAANLMRLRHGSQGPRVARLQTALGLAPDSSQLIGPVTRKTLIDRQAIKLGWADGIYSPAMDGLLGLDIFATA
jgi:hypothetical protein